MELCCQKHSGAGRVCALNIVGNICESLVILGGGNLHYVTGRRWGSDSVSVVSWIVKVVVQ